MVHSTTLELHAAFRALDAAETEQERYEAVERFAAAERAHFQRLGYGNPQSWISRLVPPVLVAVLAVIAFVVIQNSAATGDAAAQAKAIAQAQHQAALDDCHRRNAARRSAIHNLRADRRNLEADRDFLQQVAPQATALIAAKQDAIEAKTEAIHGALSAIADVAIHPDSATADCRKAN